MDVDNIADESVGEPHRCGDGVQSKSTGTTGPPSPTQMSVKDWQKPD